MIYRLFCLLFSLFVGCVSTQRSVKRIVVPSLQGTIEVRTDELSVSDLIEQCATSTDVCHRMVYGVGYALASRRGHFEGNVCLAKKLEASYFRSELLGELTQIRDMHMLTSANAAIIDVVEKTYPCVVNDASDWTTVVDLDMSVEQLLHSCDKNELRCEASMSYVLGRLNEAMRANMSLFMKTMQNYCPNREGPTDLSWRTTVELSRLRNRMRERSDYGSKKFIDEVLSDALFDGRCTLTEPPPMTFDVLELFSFKKDTSS